MIRGVVAFLILILIIPLVFSISIKELIARYSFSTVTVQMNVTNHIDFMVDKNNNGLNDTLVFELTTNNTNGTFIFVINLFDKNGILTNETNKTLGSGINKLNITFSSTLLSQNQFNYSIKIYNSSRSLKYRKDNILTQGYLNYEEGFRVTDVKDLKVNKTLQINVTLSSHENKTHVTTLFLSYNNSLIFSKKMKSLTSPTSHLVFDFDNETIKRTHYIGNFTITSVKIGRKTLKTNFTTGFYDFRDFAVTSYIYNFTDNGSDANSNSKYDFLEINASIKVLKDSNYTIAIALYDLFDNVVEIKNTSFYISAGNGIVPIHFNGTMIYEKKLNGPYVISSIELFENSTLTDQIKDAYTTGNYNFNDFEKPNLPDLKAIILVSDAYKYGISNITINFTFKNIGNKHAFNVFADLFDNITFSQSNKSNILDVNSQIIYQFNFTNISDFEISAVADLKDFVEELNESNNAESIVIKLNKKPTLESISNMTVNETNKILINLSASDLNEDNLTYSINLSKFSSEKNVFQWNTTTIDSGNYTLLVTVSDGFLNDSKLFRITILDAPEKDIDNDGIEDDIDALVGFESSVNVSNINLSILLNQSKNLSKLFRHHTQVMFMEGSFPLAEFDYNFSKHKLRLHNITLRKQSVNITGSLLIRGLIMHGATKTLYIDKINATNGICIKDEEISAINEISSNCELSNEFKVECDGTLQSNYICIYNSTINKYKVQGLKHSGIIQIDYTKPASSSSSSTSAVSSGSGSGGVICISDWQCSEWSECIEEFRSRKCVDKSQCAFPTNKPIEIQECNQESKLVDIIKPFDYFGKSTNRIKQKFQSKKPFGITGQAVKTPQRSNVGIFIVFIEVVIIVSIYLTVKRIYRKYI